MVDIHCSICGKSTVHINDYENEEEQESLRRSVRLLESIAICNGCRGENNE